MNAKFFALVLLMALTACSRQKEPVPAPAAIPNTPPAVPRVLERITFFSPPPLPLDPANLFETYDHRKNQNRSVPPTKIDTLVCDFWTVATVDLGMKVTSPSQLTGKDVRAAIRFYENNTWRQIRGFRPWTHWNFIDRLTSAERDTLAEEAHAYMVQHGIKNGAQ